MHLRINDVVEILSGDDKGKRGKILSVNREDNKVTVQGVNLVYRHMKPSRGNQQGGRLSKEMPIAASNVGLIDPNTNSPTRVGIRYEADGTKILIARKSGTTLRVLSKPKATYAQKS